MELDNPNENYEYYTHLHENMNNALLNQQFTREQLKNQLIWLIDSFQDLRTNLNFNANTPLINMIDIDLRTLFSNMRIHYFQEYEDIKKRADDLINPIFLDETKYIKKYYNFQNNEEDREFFMEHLNHFDFHQECLIVRGKLDDLRGLINYFIAIKHPDYPNRQHLIGLIERIDIKINNIDQKMINLGFRQNHSFNLVSGKKLRNVDTRRKVFKYLR